MKWIKGLGAALAAALASTASAAQLTIAVTLAMDAQTVADLAAAAERLSAVVPTRLAVQGVPIADDWARRPYWRADAAEQAALKAELQEAWAAFAKDLPATGVEIDPAFFRRHRITTAPVFVLETAHAKEKSCESHSEAEEAEEADVIRVRGNVTAGFALDAMAREADAVNLSSKTKALIWKAKELGLW